MYLPVARGTSTPLCEETGASCAVAVIMLGGRQWGGWIELKGST